MRMVNVQVFVTCKDFTDTGQLEMLAPCHAGQWKALWDYVSLCVFDWLHTNSLMTTATWEVNVECYENDKPVSACEEWRRWMTEHVGPARMQWTRIVNDPPHIVQEGDLINE